MAFRAEGELQAWLAAKGYAQGAVLTPQTVYDLGAEWYATRLDVDWQPWTPSQAQAMFDRHGLHGPFWAL